MIQQAVLENLHGIRGPASRRGGRLARRLMVAARLVFFVSLPAALFASTFVLSTVASDWRDDPWAEANPAVASVASTAGLGALEVVPPLEASAGQPMPRPIDPSILPLALRTVVLDPGHGGDNRGTRTPDGLEEKEITLDIARRLRALLEESGYQVVVTRDADVSLSLRQRADLANAARGDIFVSIHVNWIENREVRGVETFYLGATDDPYLEALAARENQESGYSLADLKDILQQVYAGVRQEESRRLAANVQQSLFESLRQVNSSVRNRGVKSAPFGVLTRTEMPAVLVEVSCGSNQVEARLLMTSIYRHYLAEAIFRGIESYSSNLVQAARLDG